MRESGPDLPVIVASAHGDIGDAVEAMKLGAYDYLVKPFDPDELVFRLRKAVRERRLLNRVEAGRRSEDERGELIGESPAIREAVRVMEKAAASSATILLTGESGTGKEVAVRLVHQMSRRPGPFVAVNLGALPEPLIESELFGYERARSRARKTGRRGCSNWPRAETMFLDEIGELPPHLQVQVASRAAGAEGATSGRNPKAYRWTPHRRGDESGSGAHGAGRRITGGSLLQDKRHPVSSCLR
jgi:DNA-binding NtrC family response regulator